MKIIYYKVIKIIIDILSLIKIIINIIMRYYSFLNLIINDWKSFLPQNSSYYYVIFLVLSKNFLPPSIYWKTNRLRGKIV